MVLPAMVHVVTFLNKNPKIDRRSVKSAQYVLESNPQAFDGAGTQTTCKPERFGQFDPLSGVIIHE